MYFLHLWFKAKFLQESIINHHQPSSTIINHHQPSSMHPLTINSQQRNHHQPAIIIIIDRFIHLI